MYLYIAGYIGLKGTVEISKRKENELGTYFPTHMIERAKKLCEKDKLSQKAYKHVKEKAIKVWDVSECGLFGALWDLSKELNKGFEVLLSKVPLKQETIEICEYYDLNPYRLYSKECILFGTNEDGLNQYSFIEDTPIVYIGKTSEKKAKEVHYDNNILYLTPQIEDEMYRVINT